LMAAGKPSLIPGVHAALVPNLVTIRLRHCGKVAGSRPRGWLFFVGKGSGLPRASDFRGVRRDAK
jgi:hypothetical protein